MLAANKVTARRTSSNAAVVPSAPHVAGATSSDGSDLTDRVAALEAHLSQLRQLESIPSLRSIKSSGLSITAANSSQIVQGDSALREQLSELQQQIEALMTSKASKADLDSFQLHAAVLGGGSGGAKDDSNVYGAATSSNAIAGGVGGAGGMGGLLEAVQKMVGGKADKEEVQGLRRLLGDKLNLADHQVPPPHLSLSAIPTCPSRCPLHFSFAITPFLSCPPYHLPVHV